MSRDAALSNEMRPAGAAMTYATLDGWRVRPKGAGEHQPALIVPSEHVRTASKDVSAKSLIDEKIAQKLAQIGVGDIGGVAARAARFKTKLS